MGIVGDVVTSAEAAKMLGVSDVRVRQFYREGRLPAQRVGIPLFFDRKAVIRFAKLRRRTGRPPLSRKTKKDR